MPYPWDEPVHQYAAECQKHHAGTHEGCRDEEITSSAHLKPCRFRKRYISGQKHQREQRRNDNINDLTGRVGQAFRRLCDQSFPEFHIAKMDCKNKKIRLISQIFFQDLPNQRGLKAPLHGVSGQFTLFFEVVGRLYGLGLAV